MKASPNEQNEGRGVGAGGGSASDLAGKHGSRGGASARQGARKGDFKATGSGERKLVTVLFADVSDYTRMSESLELEDVHQIMNGCFRVLLEEVHKYEGTVDKLLGDGVMVLFGVPIAKEDHAQRACHAAISMMAAVREYGESVKRTFGVDFNVSIGVNSGHVYVGPLEGDEGRDFSAIGDAINIASRLEAIAAPGQILVSENTYRAAKSYFRFDPLGKRRVKGKRDCVEVYELVSRSGVDSRLGAAAQLGLTAFVGREKELAFLRAAFEKASLGSGQVVWVVGEPGVGKSRLLLELKSRTNQDSHVYLEGRCPPYGVSTPYLPIREALLGYFGISRQDDGPLMRERMVEGVARIDEALLDALPALHDLLSIAVDDERYSNLGPVRKKESMFGAVKDLVAKQSRTKPVVLALDDLHWTDSTTMDFLSYLIDCLADVNVLLLLTSRPDFEPPLHWQGRAFFSTLVLEGLPDTVSRGLLQSLLYNVDAGQQAIDLIAPKAQGNPLFMEELAQLFMETGCPSLAGSADAGVEIPPSIRGIIESRIDRLGDDLKSVLQLASAIGPSFDAEILGMVVGRSETVDSDLQALQRLGFICKSPGCLQEEYIFKSVLTQEVAYSCIPSNMREEAHRQIAEALEGTCSVLSEQQPEALAYHYLRSGDSLSACRYYELAARRAVRRGSNWEALGLYREAVTALDSPPDTKEKQKEQLRILRLSDLPMRLLGYPGDSLRLLEKGRQLSRVLGDDRAAAIMDGNLGFCYLLRGDLTSGSKLLADCAEKARRLDGSELTSSVVFDLLTSYYLTGRFSSVVRVAPKVIASVDEPRDGSGVLPKPLSSSFGTVVSLYYALSLAWLGRFDEVEAVCRSLSESSASHGTWLARIAPELARGYALVFRGDGAGAVEHLQYIIEQCEKEEIRVLLGQAHTLLGWAYLLQGDIGDASRHIENAIASDSDAGSSMFAPMTYYCSAMASCQSGDLEEAHDSISSAIRIARDANQKHIEAMSEILLGEVLARRDKSQYVWASDHVNHGLQKLGELGVRPFEACGWLSLAGIHADASLWKEAVSELRQAYSLFRQMGMNAWLQEAKRMLERFEVCGRDLHSEGSGQRLADC